MLKYLQVKEKEALVKAEISKMNHTLLDLSLIKIFIYLFALMGLLITGVLLLIAVKDADLSFAHRVLMAVSGILVGLISFGLVYREEARIIRIKRKRELKKEEAKKIDKEVKDITINHHKKGVKINESSLEIIMKNDFMLKKLNEMVNEYLGYKQKNELPLIEKLKKANWLEKVNIKVYNE